MNRCYGWDVEETYGRAEKEAAKCLKAAMEKTGRPETDFTVSIDPDDDGYPTYHWSVKLTSEK